MKTKLPILCFLLLAAGFLTEAKKKVSAQPGGPGGGDDSPIEVAEGSHYVCKDTGLTVDNSYSRASADESGYYAYAFMLEGCKNSNCSVDHLQSGWKATLYDKNVPVDEYFSSGPYFVAHNLTGEPFAQDGSCNFNFGTSRVTGNKVKHNHSLHFDHFDFAPGSAANQHTLKCPGGSKCKAVVLYCVMDSTPPNGWSCK